MHNEETQIVEAVSGRWLRFPNCFRKSSCLVELSGQLSLSIDTRNGKIHVHQKDHNEVYQYVGEVFISVSNNQIQCSAQQARVGDWLEPMFTAPYQNGMVETDKAEDKEESA